MKHTKKKITIKKKRKYFRKCGCCGLKQEQSMMIRSAKSPNGWFCSDCYFYNKKEEHPEYDEFGEE